MQDDVERFYFLVKGIAVFVFPSDQANKLYRQKLFAQFYSDSLKD